VVRRSLLVLLLAGLLAVPASAQTGGGAPTLLMPGATYERRVEFTPHGPVVLNVITAPRPDGSLYRLEPLLSNNAVVATDKLTSIEKQLAPQATIAAVNADYYGSNPGDPRGILIRGGVLDSPPAEGRSSLGIQPDGTLRVARVTFAGIWRGTGQRRALTIDEPSTAGPVTLYTPAWGPTTPPEQNVLEDVIPSLAPTRPNTDITGTVGSVANAGGVPIPPGGAVLVARSSQVPIVQREAPTGQSVFFRMTLTPDWSGMTGAIGGGPLLVQNGRPVFRANESIGAALLNPRTSRSAIGQLPDGRIVLATADGGTPGYSVGMTNFELALAMQQLGAVTAMALGSGQQATMAFDGGLLSKPSGRAEGQVSDAIGILYTGVYAPPPSDLVFSPNGDGVAETETLAYKLVTPATVNAVVTGGGATTTLDFGHRDAGVHTFSFSGKRSDGSALPEGGYRFLVTARDDRGRTSTAERHFAINNTLAALAVAPAQVQLRRGRPRSVLLATFTLAEPATISATIETRGGIVIDTLATGGRAPGPQRLLWNGRTAAGTLAFGGAYQVHVRAGNAIGRVDLTAPFTARRG
jgi:hypothetical protein